MVSSVPKPLYNAARYLATGHPAYKADYLHFVERYRYSASQGDRAFADIALQGVIRDSGLTAAEVTRMLIRSFNGLNPHQTSRPRN